MNGDHPLLIGGTSRARSLLIARHASGMARASVIRPISRSMRMRCRNELMKAPNARKAASMNMVVRSGRCRASNSSCRKGSSSRPMRMGITTSPSMHDRITCRRMAHAPL